MSALNLQYRTIRVTLFIPRFRTWQSARHQIACGRNNLLFSLSLFSFLSLLAFSELWSLSLSVCHAFTIYVWRAETRPPAFLRGFVNILRSRLMFVRKLFAAAVYNRASRMSDVSPRVLRAITREGSRNKNDASRK
jgi:hypothetical protein